MGADIHIVAEERSRQFARVNSWYPIYKIEFEVWRNYKLFAKLADVRNYELGHYQHIAPISPPRGVPEDASDWVKAWAKEGRADHSFSWISSDEFFVNITPELSEDFYHLGRYLLHNRFQLYDVRLIFGFDNLTPCWPLFPFMGRRGFSMCTIVH